VLFHFWEEKKVSWWEIWWVRVVRERPSLILTLSCFISLVRSWGTHLADFLVTHGSLWSMVKMVSMKSSITMEKAPDLHPAVILKGDWNKGHEVSVLMIFLELNHRCYTEMERVSGNGRQKCHFLNNQLIGPARVFNKKTRKFVLLLNLFSSTLSKMYYFCLFA
jgi:hypothetical protein